MPGWAHGSCWIARELVDVKIRCADKAPDALNDIGDAEEMGARWEGEEAVTYDLDGFLEQFRYYEANDYLVDNH